MKRTSSVFTLVLLCAVSLCGQIGGDFAFQFLQLSPSARATALGGVANAVSDGDIGLAYYHPAMLSEETHQAIGFHHSFYAAGISHGLVSYGSTLGNTGIHAQGGIQYIDYGSFDGFNTQGEATAAFEAGDIAIFVGASRAIYEKLTAGVNIKFVQSNLGNYSSAAVAMDLSFIYHDDVQNLGLSLLVRNVGVQISSFDEVEENLPLDIQLGITKRLKYLPFRVGAVLHTLNRWDLGYDDPRLDEPGSLFGTEETDSELSFLNKFSRHLVLNGEFLLGPKENFNLRFSYSNQRRAELQVASFRNLAGFAFGFGLRANRFHIDYGARILHVAGTAHHFSLRTHIHKFKKDREL